MGGDVETLLQDFKMIQVEGEKLGLLVNEAKCEIITDDQQVVSSFRFRQIAPIAPTIKHVNSSSAMLLGAAIGGTESMDSVLELKLEDLRCLSSRLSLLNARDALYLLKNCFSIPKLTYSLCCAPCYSRHLLAEYDAVLRSSLQSIINVDLSDEAWEQATLPVANAGLGIRRATDIALPAFISSVAGSQSLISQLMPQRLQHISGVNDPAFNTALLEWQTRSESGPAQPPFATKQKVWDAALVKLQEAKVSSAAQDQASKARLIAAAAPHSGAFLHARPCGALGTKLDNSPLRIAVALRLGAAVCLQHKCVCGATVDCTGRHGLSCLKSAGRFSRHSAVNELIKRALKSAEIPSRLEPTSLNRHDDTRPDGLTLCPWASGKCLAWDFTCADTLAPSHLNTAVTGPGRVACEAEAKKRDKYSSLTSLYHFVPVAVETLGSLGDEASAFLHELGRRIAAVSGDTRATNFLMQRVSVAIQRGNAACVLGTMDNAGDGQSLDAVFYL